MRDGKNTQLKWHFENCNNLTCSLELKEYIDLSYFHSLYLTVAFLYCSIENEDGKNIFTFSFVMLHLSGIFVLFHGKRKKHLHISIYHVAIIGHRHNFFPIVLKFDLFAYQRCGSWNYHHPVRVSSVDWWRVIDLLLSHLNGATNKNNNNGKIFGTFSKSDEIN